MNSRVPILRPVRRTVVFLAASAVIVLLLGTIHVLPIPNPIRLVRVLADFGHAPVFAVIAVALLRMVRARGDKRTAIPTRGDYAIAGILVTALAVASEFAQLGLAERSASPVDVLRDLLGASLGLSYCVCRYGRVSTGARRRLGAVAVVLIVALGAPTLWTIAGYVSRDAQWPTIVAPESRLDLIFLHPFESEIQIISLPEATNGASHESGLLVHLNDQIQSGIMVEELPSDSAIYGRICTDITNPDEDAIIVTVWLGNRTSIIRSTSLAHRSQFLPAESRQSSCSQLSTEGIDKLNGGFQSLGLTAQPTGTPRDLIVHRIWLD